MLTSITPLGERSRNSSWAVTVAAFATGSTAAGALAGAAAGAAGSLGASVSPGFPAASAVLGGAALVGASLDLKPAGLRLPTVSRQVNEDWLHLYRGWAYGAGFGFQLGLGFVTVVSSSALYLAFLAALLSGSTGAGALIGGAFGLLRAAPLLAGVGVRTPERLFLLGRRLARWRRPSLALALCAQVALAVAALAGVVG